MYICMYTIVNEQLRKNNTHKLSFPGLEITFSNQVRCFQGVLLGIIYHSVSNQLMEKAHLNKFGKKPIYRRPSGPVNTHLT